MIEDVETLHQSKKSHFNAYSTNMVSTNAVFTNAVLTNTIFLLCSATATFMINELVNNYEENKAIVDNLNIHFLPMANPDGYEYSRNTDRMWRKNRNRDNKAAGGTYLPDPTTNFEFGIFL